ncbi:DUF4160 domain-containing protein [Thermodesulfatator autotrophicus]|uniref:DUF4160 domain-containing protein n=1 Tax=Thermodesulfatator autotrophicus TaxID=1795632 RepID=UPI0009ECFD2A|nr:DUF4160 domain-containing protein [Thermodesulfatator autotrophicus]
MSQTVLKIKGYRFFFFSREEPRKHVHVHCANGEAKFWLEEEVALAKIWFEYKETKRNRNNIEHPEKYPLKAKR